MKYIRLIGLVLIIISSLYNIIGVYSAPTLREYLNTGGDSNNSFRGTSWLAQTFTTPSLLSQSHTVTAVKLYLRAIGGARDMICGIRATNAGKPTGSDLTSSTVSTGVLSGTLSWCTFTMSVEITLSVDTMYAIVIRCPTGDGSNQPYWNYDNANGYSLGTKLSSSDSGSTWTIASGDDYLFEVWGNDATASMTFTSTYTGSGYLKVNSVSQNTPYTNTYLVGEVVLIEALSPRVIYADVERKVYISWSDSGSQTHNYTVPLGGATVTANYHTEYKHIISANPISGSDILLIDDSARTSPYTTGWLDSGTTISLNCTLFPSGASEGYAFNYWGDYLARHHHVAPTSSANYTAYYLLAPFYGGGGGNVTVDILLNNSIDQLYINGTHILTSGTTMFIGGSTYLVSVLVGSNFDSAWDLSSGWIFPLIVCSIILALSVISLFIPLVGLASVAMSLGVLVYQVINVTDNLFRAFTIVTLFISALFLIMGRNRYNGG